VEALRWKSSKVLPHVIFSKLFASVVVMLDHWIAVFTGHNQSVTGCVSQGRQCSCYSTKTRVNSMTLILKLNLTSLRNIYTHLCVVFNEDHFYVYVSQRRHIKLLLTLVFVE